MLLSPALLRVLAVTPPTIWTLGHSNLPLEDFLERLSCYEIAGIADVRRFPGSRRQPQFSKDLFPSSMKEHGINYRWFEALGGRRRPLANSSNTAWRNVSFRGYADYMASEEFLRALEQLLEFASLQRTALMCAEVLWWRCHRALISDVLRLRGAQVIHILDLGKTVEHPFTSPARIVEGQLTYAS
jgi:uncharacterized protein (DUF488 family)